MGKTARISIVHVERWPSLSKAGRDRVLFAWHSFGNYCYSQHGTAELIKYVDDYMRRAIASHLNIRRKTLITSTILQEQVERYLVTAKAIAATHTNDEAVDVLGKLSTKPTTRGQLIADLETCYETLNPVVAGFEYILPMLRRTEEPKVIWEFLRSRVSVAAEFDDDWIRSADAWIMRGEVIHVPMGWAKIDFLPSAAPKRRST